jgi:hypothetical protein
MNARQATPQTAQEAPIVILRPSEKYFEQMCQLDAKCYPLEEDKTQWITPDYYRSQMIHFPEGQFIAVDTATDQVVGLTQSMRVDFDPEQPLLESWYQTTNYG